MSGPLRIPLSWPLNNRNTTLFPPAIDQPDARRVNVMDEPRTDGQPGVYTLKRPGRSVYATPAGAVAGQGCCAMNGAVFSVFGDNLYVTTPTPSGADMTGTISAAAPPWGARAVHRCVVLNDQIFLLGGLNTASTWNGDVWITSDGSNWRMATNAAPWAGRAGFGAAVLNGKIFVFGGLAGTTYFNDVWSSPDGTTWTQETPSAGWAGRTLMGVAAGNNGIYLFGGSSAGGALNNDLWYTADGAIWSQVTATGGLPAVRSSPSLLYFNNKLYVIGGSNGGGVGINEVWSTPNGQVWTLESAGPFASGTYAHGAVVYGGKMWVIGGYTAAGARVQTTYSTATGTGAWTLVSSALPTGANGDLQSVVFRSPVSSSQYRYPTIWSMGGINGAVFNNVWYGTLNLTVASFSLLPSVGGQPYQFASFKAGTQVLIKNQSNLWVFTEGTVIPVTDTAYPAVTVPGVVVLGGFAYVMDPTGLIRNCVLDDPFHWPSLNVIGADYEDDAGVCLAKLQNYVVAFGSYTTQFFRDAGVDTGSPLVPYLAANLKVGAAYASSVAEVGVTLAFVSQTRQLDRKAVMFDGLTPKPFSNLYIEKLLAGSGLNNINGLCFGCEGHLFYVLNSSAASTALVYDFDVKQWYEWTDSAGNPFYFADATNTLSPGGYIVQGINTGKLYGLSASTHADDTGNFRVLLQTQKFDAGNNRMKFWGRLDFIADVNPGTPTIQFSDDDYVTWTAARTVDMSLERPALFRNGASRRRAFRYIQQDANPMRLEAFEQEYAP